jgi:hypothetical protein
MHRRILVLPLIIATALLAVAPAMAQEEEAAPGPMVHHIIDVYPASGQAAEFEAGVKAHEEWAVANGDDWVWWGFQVISGAHTGMYRFGSYNHAWADFDNPPTDPAASAANIDENIVPYVAHMDSSFAVTRPDMSHYSRMSPAPMYQVIWYTVKPTQADAFENAFKKFVEAVTAEAPEFEFVVHQTVIGNGNEYMLAIPRENFASFADEGDEDILEETFGEYESRGIMQHFMASVAKVESSLVVLRPDLSMMPMDGMEGME